MNNLIDGVFCPECYNSDIETDPIHMIKFCSRCGLIVQSEEFTSLKEAQLQYFDKVRFIEKCSHD